MVSNPIILVVEDNQNEQFTLKELLQRFDYEAHVVANCEEALAAMSKHNYSGILMDITLPGKDGYECTREIRKIHQHKSRRIPIIALTARCSKTDQQACLCAGMDDYMSKPFNPEDLRKMLLRHIYVPERPNLKLLDTSDDLKKK